MTMHARIRENLYDDIMGDVTPDLHTEIERHLLTCDSCRTARADILRTLSLLRPPERLPSEERSQEFWNTFAARVDQELDASPRRIIPAKARLEVGFHSVLGMRWRSVAAVAAGFAIVAGAFLLLWDRTQEPAGESSPVTAELTASRSGLDKKAAQYFRRSQTVLVGLTNKRPEVNRRVDIDAERAASRSLATDGRLLKHQIRDPESAKLVGDLERIFIEVANSSPQEEARDVEMIRGGIRQENLLFKVRMAQVRYEPDGNQ